MITYAMRIRPLIKLYKSDYDLIKMTSDVAEKGQNKQASSNWPPVSDNKVPFWFIKNTLYHTRQEKW